MNGIAQSNPDHRHLTGAFGFMVAQLVALAAGLIVQSVAARNLEAADYARFAVAHTLVLMATHLLCGVLPRAFARHLSVNPASLSTIFRSLITLQLPAALVISLLMWGCRNELGWLLADEQMARLITIVAILVVIHCGVLEPCWYILNALRKHRLQAILLAMHGILRCGAVSLAVWHRPDGGWPIAGLLIATVGSTVLVLPFVVGLLRRESRVRNRQGLSVGEIWNWVRFSSLVDLAYYAAVAFSLWSVKAHIADDAIVAVYAASFVLAQVNLPICRTVSRGFFSYVAAAYGTGTSAESARLVRSAGRLLLIFLCLELAIAAVVGDSFVELFSGMTLEHPGLPATLLLGSAMVGACFVLSELLAAANQLRLRFLAAALYGPIAVAMGFFATARYGILGAAGAFCASGLITLTVLTLMCRQTFGKWDLLPTLLRCVIAGGISAGATIALRPIGGILEVIFSGLMVTFLYFASLSILREFSAAEIRQATTFLSRRPVLPTGAQIQEKRDVRVS